jgi:DNA-binding transcriptional LysR family regulator
MEFSDLETFLAVYEQRSFSKAAAKLFTSQPTVSARVAALEREVGHQLFERTSRGTIPTVAGDVLASSAFECVAARNSGLSALSALSSAPRPVLRLGVSTSLAEMFIPQLYDALSDLGITVNVVTANTVTTHRSLLNHELDAAILVATPIHSGFVTLPILRSEFIWVASPHGMDSHATHDLAALATQRLAPYDFGTGFTALFDEIKRVGNLPDLGVVGPLAAARRLVRDHGYVSFLPIEAVREDLAAGVLAKLNVIDAPKATWEVVIAYRKRTPQPSQIRNLKHVAQKLWPSSRLASQIGEGVSARRGRRGAR